MKKMASGVKCCRCASIGLCLRCSCVVTGRPCLDCYLSRKGHCCNKWNKGKFDDLLKEVRAIQARLNKGQRYKSNQSVSLSRSFAGLMFPWKAESAIQLLG